MAVFTHNVPDYPIGNLEAAQRGRDIHCDCGPECEAKPYFTDVAERLERAAGVTQPSLRSTWNIW